MPTRTPEQLNEDLLAIWRAGVDAVDSRKLVCESMLVTHGLLRIVDELIPLEWVGRIAVVGAGKAGAGMAEGVIESLGEDLVREKQLTGVVNVPEDCVRPCGPIHLHGARPAGVNEPTEAGVEGAQRILQLVESLASEDLCICLISGGGSALLPAPVDGITLEDKQKITRFLSGAGANIEQLNTVRKQLSKIKGGGLLQRCSAQVVTLIVSDVIGDPLDVIASGPTMPNTTTAADAIRVLEQFDPHREHAPAAVWAVLERQAAVPPEPLPANRSLTSATYVIGNNAVAVDAAGMEAERRGYSHAMWAATELEGSAEEVGIRLAEMADRMRREAGPDCLITGGEPTVTLAPESVRGRGGRNQQLVLAAAQRLWELGQCDGVALLSGGTDGEDGPTDAAGGFCDSGLLAVSEDRAALEDAMQRNDAYPFLQQRGKLLTTGPTHTNVCDLRVVVVDRVETPAETSE